MATRFRGRPLGATVVVLLLISASAEYGTRYVEVFRVVDLMRHSGVGLRAKLEMSLEQTPERDLVIVRYGEHHGLEEWVYNHADIDASHVVWAREMDAANNRKLLRHFRDRKAWLLTPDERPLRLVPYSEGTGPVSPAESGLARAHTRPAGHGEISSGGALLGPILPIPRDHGAEIDAAVEALTHVLRELETTVRFLPCK